MDRGVEGRTGRASAGAIAALAGAATAPAGRSGLEWDPGKQRTVTTEALTCPGCGSSLTVEESSSHYGSRLLVTRCQICGGIFTSWGKLVALAPAEAERWCAQPRRIGATAPREATAERSHTPPRCPVCAHGLHAANERELPPPLTLPEPVELHLCAAGHGFWLTQSDLLRFKQSQRSRLHRKRTEDLAEREREALRRATLALFSDQAREMASGNRMLWYSMVVLLAFLALAMAGTLLVQIALS